MNNKKNGEHKNYTNPESYNENHSKNSGSNESYYSDYSDTTSENNEDLINTYDKKFKGYNFDKFEKPYIRQWNGEVFKESETLKHKKNNKRVLGCNPGVIYHNTDHCIFKKKIDNLNKKINFEQEKNINTPPKTDNKNNFLKIYNAYKSNKEQWRKIHEEHIKYVRYKNMFWYLFISSFWINDLIRYLNGILPNRIFNNYLYYNDIIIQYILNYRFQRYVGGCEVGPVNFGEMRSIYHEIISNSSYRWWINNIIKCWLIWILTYIPFGLTSYFIYMLRNWRL